MGKSTTLWRVSLLFPNTKLCAVIYYLDFDQSNMLTGASHRARIQAIFAADFDIEGCSQEEMDRTYRLETKRGKNKSF